MTTRIEAIYENGIFRPRMKVVLTEGTRVEVLISQPDLPRDPRAVAARLAEISLKSTLGNATDSTSIDVDADLYSRDSQP